MIKDMTAEGTKQKTPKAQVVYSDDEENMPDNLPESMPPISRTSKRITKQKSTKSKKTGPRKSKVDS